jgi:endonuclease-3
VNTVTLDLFGKYRTPQDFVQISREVLEKDVRSTGFYHNKAKSIQGACQTILEKFGGIVPDTMEELLQLPGVARKTANVVLGVAFGKAEGIVVDTHVYRVSRRLDLTVSETPENIERDLMQFLPRSRWISFSHQIILHGRTTCKARKPLCLVCPVSKLCDANPGTS